MGVVKGPGKPGPTASSMISVDLNLAKTEKPTILCLGAHSDDIEIGALATILDLSKKYRNAEIRWVVFGAVDARADEAKASAEHCVREFRKSSIEIHGYRDGFFPSDAIAIKEAFETLKDSWNPDVIFTHYGKDAHQDHRIVSELTWQTFRNHLILEYEIPKYDGDMGSPNVFHAIEKQAVQDKVDVLLRFFATQGNRSWFTRDTFQSLMRLRGVECNSITGFAEAFYCRKMTF
jgi:LmbE family N-acetylglucosaminyl deacetylase